MWDQDDRNKGTICIKCWSPIRNTPTTRPFLYIDEFKKPKKLNDIPEKKKKMH